MRSFLTLYGPSIIEAILKLQSIAKKFRDLTGNTSLRENSDLIQGKYDYVFNWHEEPALPQIMNLIKILDDELVETKIRYSITTLETFEEDPAEINSENFVSYLKFIGPGIYYTINKLKNLKFEKIKKHGLTKGYSDYFMEWDQNPSNEDIKNLIQAIDDYLPNNFNVSYKITTKDSSLALKRLQLAQLMVYSHFPYS